MSVSTDTTSAQKKLGAYYTPEPMARSVVRWALDGRVGTVLDPSYGGCTFLRAAIEELRALGEAKPECRVYGADIDPSTAQWTAKLAGQGVPKAHLPLTNFFDAVPAATFPLCDAVVGNPPYIRHHWIGHEKFAQLAALRDRTGLSARASAWAYFVIHATEFVKPGGRMAMLLPGAVLHADYAKATLDHLNRNFVAIELVRVEERIFPDAVEETVLLMAVGRRAQSPTLAAGPSPNDVRVRTVRTSTGLQDALARRDRPSSHSTHRPAGWFSCVASYKWELLPRGARSLLSELVHHPAVQALGLVSKIRIGLVTGANEFFVLRRGQIPTEAGVDAVPILRTSAWLQRPRWIPDDVAALSDSDSRAFLMSAPPDLALEKAVEFARLVARAEEGGLHERHHCCQRRPWWSMRELSAPDAFLTYMVARGPCMALNEARSLCTNSIHSVVWSPEVTKPAAQAIVASAASTLFAVSAELVGRHYGGGVLKLEPNEASRLLVSTALPAEALAELDGEARDGAASRVRELADKALWTVLGVAPQEGQVLAEALELLRASRHPMPNGSRP